MGLFATGVTVINYVVDGAPASMTANPFMSVSITPTRPDFGQEAVAVQ